ncbi:MAG: AMP-binding protein [Gammaproteobacteria bacterium]|nr:AMP-binding protein [Gammaproteobacteria bacterium]
MRVIRYTEAMVEEFVRDGYWTTETFFDFYDRNARERPDDVALVDSRFRVTWAEARELVDAIATAWVEAGIEKDARIIIQAPNSVYGFLARVAAERAGLVSLTAFATLRRNELEYMLEKTGAQVAVIPHVFRGFDYLAMYAELQGRFPSLQHIYLFEDEVPAAAPAGTRSLLEAAAACRGRSDAQALAARRFDPLWDVALLTTTSGTTGLPKLVEWPLAPRVCTSKGRVELWELGPDDVTMAIAPHAGGAAGTLTYFAAPLAGARTVMLEDFDPQRALETIARERVTAIGVVPTHLVRMLEQDVEKYDLSSLRFIRSAGGYLSPQLAREAEARLRAVITSDLGTQDKGSVCGCRVSDPPELRRLTVGRMLPGNRVRLLGGDGEPVAEGEPGVLWFRGPHSPAGYYRDEAMTSEVFGADGWCTTEDLVKFDQGCLWILGRQKDVIIRGGQNIYPAEVEGLLNEHPAVAAVAVVGMPDPEYGERSCAYVTPRKDQTVTLEDLKAFLGERGVAKYKWPERLELTPAMPTVGDSGKVDKKALRADLDRKLDGSAPARMVSGN